MSKTSHLSQTHALIQVSPFFPPPIEAEPGRAKGESRITCMGMLRTKQSNITGPNHAARVNVSHNAFFSSRSEKNIFF